MDDINVDTDFLNGFPCLDALPCDHTDQRYTRCFDSRRMVTEGQHSSESLQMLEFFREYGFVVLGNVFDAKECQETQNAMWDIVERINPAFKRESPATWDNVKGSANYGLFERNPVFHPILVRNRQHPVLAEMLHRIVYTRMEDVGDDKATIEPDYGDKSNAVKHVAGNEDAAAGIDRESLPPPPLPIDDLMVSHDRFALYRAAFDAATTSTCSTATTNTNTNSSVEMSPTTSVAPHDDATYLAVPATERQEAIDAIEAKEPNESVAAGSAAAAFATSTAVPTGTVKYNSGEPNIHLDLNPWWWLAGNPQVVEGIDTLQYGQEPPKEQEKDQVTQTQTQTQIRTHDEYKHVFEERSTAAVTSSTQKNAGQHMKKKAIVKKTSMAVNAMGKKKKASTLQDFIRENNMVVRTMGRHVQCVLNFLPNTKEDGGTIVVPKFHHYLPMFCEIFHDLQRPMPWMKFPPKNEENGKWWRLEQQLLGRAAHRVTMRAGAVLVWDQRLAHGTVPNRSNRCRMAQYMKAFSRQQTFYPPSTAATTTMMMGGNLAPSEVNIQNDKTAAAAAAAGKEEEEEEEREGGGGNGSGEKVQVGGGKDGDNGQEDESPPISPLSAQGCHLAAPTVKIPSDRLVRRAKALKEQLLRSGAMQLVTPLGKTLFGLDVLE